MRSNGMLVALPCELIKFWGHCFALTAFFDLIEFQGNGNTVVAKALLRS